MSNIIEKDELNEMKKIRDETGIPLSRLNSKRKDIK